MAASRYQPRIVFIGRAPGNDIVLKEPGVSARHARVIVEPERLILEDLGSRNGTFVGSPPQRVDRCEIAIDATLSFGGARLDPSILADLLARTRPRQAAEPIVLGDSGTVTIGRGARATSHVTSPVASSLHASLALENGRVVVRDLGSSTGTFVNGQRIGRPVVIDPGTVVQVADSRYRLANDGRTLEPLDSQGDAIEIVSAAVVVQGGRRVLSDVSLVIEPGELVAVMGPSGSGKSTLLSLVNGQAAPAAGKVLVGGLDLHDHFELFRGRIGFVPQDDILHADLTVWQALWYAGRLRLPSDTTDEEIAGRIRAVLSQLGLEGTEQTRVGDQRKRGVSGGQRKRVNLAMELLTDPPILVLDEPTSGLSSMDALSVVELLRALADAGKTIIVTIHQPSVDVFRLFDAVAVIARDSSTRQVGQLAYFGRAWPDSVNFFEPRDDVSTPPATPDGLLRGLGSRPVAEWVNLWADSAARSVWVVGRSSGQTGTSKPHRRHKPRPVARLSQWWTLVARNLAVKASDRWNTAVLLLQAPVAAALITMVFARVLRADPTVATWAESGARMATAMFVTALAAIWFGVSATAREIVTEWPVYRRERMVGLSILSYLCSKVTVLAAVAAIQTALLVAIVAPGCGLLGSWWNIWLTLFLAAMVGGAIGLVISATSSTAEAAAGVLPILLLPMIVLGGILVPLGDLPAATRPLAAAIPSRWAFEGLVVPEALARPSVRRVVPAPEDTTEAPSRSRVPIVTVSGKKPHFILPGRRKIAEKLEEAAAQAEAELRRAEQEANRKAEEMQQKTAAEMEKRAADIRRETEESVRRAMDESKAAIEAKIEARMNEANEAVEERFREVQRTMETERARMKKALDLVENPGELVSPSTASQASDIDMAEPFFPKTTWRSSSVTPLTVLAVMAAAGVVASAIILVRRDA